MASAACGLAWRNLRVTAPRLRAGLRTPLRLRAVNEKSQIWTWANRERIGGVDGGLERIQWAERLQREQRRYLADGGRKDGDKETEKRPSPLSILLPVHENIYTLPNILTFSRLVAAPVVGYLIVHDMHMPALGLFVYAGVTDLVDGWIARKWGLQTVVGTVIDPMADKALMTVVTVTLAMKGALPVPLAVLILGRDILLGLSALYYRYISLPLPRTFTRYWDFSLPSAEVRPTTISKINTFLQLGLIGATMSGLAMGGLGETAQTALEISWWVVGTTTLWSGGSYLWGKDIVRILSKKS